MSKFQVSIATLLLASIASIGVGCESISDSSRSISKSVSSPSRSISNSSKSSSGGGKDSTYMRDVRNFSYGFAKSGGEPDAFARGIGSIAQRQGIQNWEDDADTCRAVGQGFHDAGIGKSAAEEMIGRSVPVDSKCAGWMRDGFGD